MFNANDADGAVGDDPALLSGDDPVSAFPLDPAVAVGDPVPELDGPAAAAAAAPSDPPFDGHETRDGFRECCIGENAPEPGRERRLPARRVIEFGPDRAEATAFEMLVSWVVELAREPFSLLNG